MGSATASPTFRTLGDRRDRARRGRDHRDAGDHRADDVVHRPRVAQVPADRLFAAVVPAALRRGQSRQIHRAAGNTLEVACLSTLFGVLLGTLAALGLARSRSVAARVADSFFMSPLCCGHRLRLAALMYFTLIGIRPSLGCWSQAT